MRLKRAITRVLSQLLSCCRTMCLVRKNWSRCAFSLTKRRNVSILCAIIILQLVLFQLAYYIYSKSSQAELKVMQAQLDFKLFQPVRKESDYVLIGNRSQQQQQAHFLLHSPSRYFCGLPVPKGAEGPGNLQGDTEFLGAIVLLKGGVSPYWSQHPGFNWTIDGSPESLLDFAVFSSVVCTGKLLGFAKENKLGRFLTFLQKAVSVKLTPQQRELLNSPSLCSARIAQGDASSHALLRAYAVGSQLATAYTLRDPQRRLLVSTLESPKSKLEGLATLSAILTTWAEDDERVFQSHLKKLQLLQEGEEPHHRKKTANRGFSAPFSWLTPISDPRFCVPSDLLPSCTCPRAFLTYAVAQRHRSYLMASLRDEVTRMHSQLHHNSTQLLQLLRGLNNATHPDWPHEALALFTSSLCNHSFPVSEMAAAVPVVGSVPPICETADPVQGRVCVSQDVVYRLWHTVDHVDEQLRVSQAQVQYAKLASYPFLMSLSKIVTNISSESEVTAKQWGPWLYIFSGQFDSVRLLLRTLDLPSSEPALTVGRFVVEVYSNRAKHPAPHTHSHLALRFLVDGEDATESLRFCQPLVDYDGRRLCAANNFLSFLQSEGEAGFWNLRSPKEVEHRKPENGSRSVFERICQRTSVEELLPPGMVV
ncbi:hypothetical protein AAHC03_01936 [Spirometra sp. Aus1]